MNYKITYFIKMLKSKIYPLKLLFLPKIYSIIHKNGLTNDDIKIKKGFLIFYKLNLKIPDTDKSHLLINKYKLFLTLKEQYNAIYELLNDNIIVYIENLQLEIQTSEDIFILNEIFIDGIYNIQIYRNVTLIDIGSNVGFASLFLALNKNIDKIFAFEPLVPTYQQGLNNMKRNPELSRKITAYNFGVGNREDSIEVNYNYELKGSVGVADLVSKHPDNKKTSKETIKIKPISEVYKLVNQYSPSTSIGFKIDCEGAEYHFISDLVSHQDFKKVKFIMMEWHLKGPGIIINMLTQHNFICLSFNPRGKNTGTIYAIKNE